MRNFGQHFATYIFCVLLWLGASFVVATSWQVGGKGGGERGKGRGRQRVCLARVSAEGGGRGWALPASWWLPAGRGGGRGGGRGERRGRVCVFVLAAAGVAFLATTPLFLN